MGWGMNETRTLQSLINTQCWTLYSNWTEKKRKDKHYMVVKIISMFRTAVHFFPTCQALKVARYSFSGSIPPKFKRKLRRHKQSFGKIATTVVLDKDENLL